jgi:hypothetical protein
MDAKVIASGSDTHAGHSPRLHLKRTVTYAGATPDGFDIEATQTAPKEFRVLVTLDNQRMFATEIVVNAVDDDPTPYIAAYLDGLRRRGA